MGQVCGVVDMVGVLGDGGRLKVEGLRSWMLCMIVGGTVH